MLAYILHPYIHTHTHTHIHMIGTRAQPCQGQGIRAAAAD
jgi:hypothetical protein